LRHVRGDKRPGLERATRALLGWEPKQPGLIAAIDRLSYFET
jgi:hypothetical protein